MRIKLLKRISFLLILGAFINNIASAQISIWSVDAAKYVGKVVSFEEYAYKVDYNPAAKRCLIMLADPDVNNSPVITIVFNGVRGKKRIDWLKSLEGFTIPVTGRLLKENGKFKIDGNDRHTTVKSEQGASNNDPPPLPPVPDTSRRN